MPRGKIGATTLLLFSFLIVITLLPILSRYFSYFWFQMSQRNLSHNANSFLGTMAGTAVALVVGDQTNQESRTRTTWEAAAMALWDQLGRKRLIIAVSAVPRHK